MSDEISQPTNREAYDACSTEWDAYDDVVFAGTSPDWWSADYCAALLRLNECLKAFTDGQDQVHPSLERCRNAVWPAPGPD
jgi:hypothetical protein